MDEAIALIASRTDDVRLNSSAGAEEPLDDLARAAAQDEAAFERLVHRCYERIHRWALVATGDPDDADDVLQETLVRMHRSLGGFRGDARFTSWVYRITRSAATDLERRRAGRLRKRLRMLVHRERAHADPPAVVDLVDRKRKAALIRTFWEELPAGQRQVFDLADFQGYTPAEIAEMLGMNPNTVRAHLFKARRTIRTRMLESEPDVREEKTS